MAFWLSFAKKILSNAVSREFGKRAEDFGFTRKCNVCGRSFSADVLVDGTCVLCRHAHESGESRADGGERTGPTQPADDLEAAYRILGCKETDSDTHIKNRYRQLIKECHVDSLPNDLPDYLVDAANKRFREVHQSYQRIMKARNSRG